MSNGYKHIEKYVHASLIIYVLDRCYRVYYLSNFTYQKLYYKRFGANE